jgi:hypothetical protein
MTTYLRFLFVFFLSTFLFHSQLAAQDFTKEEMILFGKTFEKVRLQKGDNFEHLKVAVEKSGLSQARFEEIWAAELQKKPIALSENEKNSFDMLRILLLEKELADKTKSESIILESGMSLERYARMMARYREDSQFQNQIYHLLNK